MLRRASVAGTGVILLTNWISEADRKAGRLVEVLPDWPAVINSFNSGIFAAFLRTRYVRRKVSRSKPQTRERLCTDGARRAQADGARPDQ